MGEQFSPTPEPSAQESRPIPEMESPREFGQKAELVMAEALGELPFVEKVEKPMSFAQERREEAPADVFVTVKGWDEKIGAQLSVQSPRTPEKVEEFRRKVRKYPMKISYQGERVPVIFIEGQGKEYDRALQAFEHDRQLGKEASPAAYLAPAEKANLTRQLIRRYVEANPRVREEFLRLVERNIPAGKKGPPGKR